MLEQLRQRARELEAQWRELSLRVRAGILVGAAVAVAAAVLAWAWSADSGMRVLAEDVGPEQVARISEHLQMSGVEYEVQDGSRVLVPEADLNRTRMSMAQSGMLSESTLGNALLNQGAFGESNQREQQRFRMALEGELGGTISSLAGVRNARVHLVMPERSLFTSEERSATASVTVHMRPGWRLREEQVEGVANLLAASVPGLEIEHVTLVDGEGHDLTASLRPEANGNVSAVEERRMRFERERQRSLQELIDGMVGPGFGMVRVSAEMDPGEATVRREIFDDDRRGTISEDILVEREQEADQVAQGLPGSASNLDGNQEGEPAPPPPATTEHTVRNLAPSREESVRTDPAGRLSRLTIAVTVDGTWEGEGDEREFVPLPEERLTQIRNVVANSAGFNEERGDQITVECIPFYEGAHPPAPPKSLNDVVEENLTLIALGAVVGLLLFGGFLYWRRRRRKAAAVALAKRRTEEAAEAARIAAEEAGIDPQELESPIPIDEIAENAKVQAALEAEAGLKQAHEQLRALAHEVARRDPEVAARVVRGWLAEDRKSDGDGEDGETEGAEDEESVAA